MQQTATLPLLTHLFPRPSSSHFHPKSSYTRRLMQGFQLIVSILPEPTTNSHANVHSSQNQVPISLLHIVNGNNLTLGNVDRHLTTFPSHSVTSSAKNEHSSREVPPHTHQGHCPSSSIYSLSMGNQVHQLSCDSAGQNVEVKRYVKKWELSETEPFRYRCLIWPKFRSHHIVRSTTFSRVSSSNYNWNYLDHLISG